MSDESKAEQQRADMAACVARVFLGSEDGKRVLGYLRARFGHDRVVFVREAGRVDALAAAMREGERHVMVEIEAALRTSSPQQWAASLI